MERSSLNRSFLSSAGYEDGYQLKTSLNNPRIDDLGFLLGSDISIVHAPDVPRRPSTPTFYIPQKLNCCKMASLTQSTPHLIDRPYSLCYSSGHKRTDTAHGVM
jgi:hypothetical protein